jgi:CubicO group peptidase (beta-lactamase class C family)
LNQFEQNLNSLFEKYTNDRRISGISAQIVQKGKTVAKVVTGLADLESEKPLREDSLFRIYSMSKVITIVAAMQLFEQGHFTLETPLSDFIPSFGSMNIITGYDQDTPLLKPAGKPLLMKHLFTMTSGIAYGFNPETTLADRYLLSHFESADHTNTEDFIEQLSGTALTFEPGDDYIYGYNHDILGRVIEIISGESFGSYLKKNIFDPLAMTDTNFVPNEEQMTRLVPLYKADLPEQMPVLVPDNDPMTNFLFRENGFESGGGGLVSSLKDYSLYCEALLNKGRMNGNRIIGRETLDLMTQNHLREKALKSLAIDGYGYGLGVRTMMNPQQAGFPGSLGEYGWGGAATTWMCIDPAKEMYAVLMLQLLNCPYPIQKEFAQVLYAGLQ